MRLKTLRKERPIFEVEGAIINGNRMDLTDNHIRRLKPRSNTSFVLPTSLNMNSPPLIMSYSDRTHQMSARSRPQMSLPSYQTIEDVYREQGIRIRISTACTTGQQSGRKSIANLQRHSEFINRNPSRTSSVLHYTTTPNVHQQQDSRSFSVLQQASSNDFEQTRTHNVSYAQSLQIEEELYPTNYIAPSIIESEHSICTPSPPPPLISPVKMPLAIPDAVSTTTTTTLYDNDSDFAYMCSLLKKPSGDSFRETIRRRAGLRDAFAAHRHSIQLTQAQTREKSPSMSNRKNLTCTETLSALPKPSPTKIDKDIIKHASRIRRISSSKDQLNKSSSSSSTKLNLINKQDSSTKSLKSVSLEPLKYILSSKTCSTSLSTQNHRSKSRDRKSSDKRAKSAKLLTNETFNTLTSFSTDHLVASTILNDESLALMRTSPIDMTRQSNSFDSGCYDHSSSGDLQSYTSSSMMHIANSIPLGPLDCSAARRSNSQKRVSFYEEPSTVILTTATYV